MKDSKEKEHRISNLRDMIRNVKDDGLDEIEEDGELIDYYNEDSANFDELEIDDEFIYRPGDEQDYAINLDEDSIDENYIIKTPDADAGDSDEIDDLNDDLASEISENFDNVIHAQVGGKPFMAIVSSVLGAILIILSIFILDSRSDRVIDNVVSGETNFIFVIFFIIGFLLLAYGVIKVFNVKNPFENITNSINSIEDDEQKDKQNTENKPSEKIIPKSNIPLEKENYKIGEFHMDDLKDSLKKPAASKKNIPQTQENLDDIPPAKEKPAEKKGLTSEEIENMEYEQVHLENETIDDIFAEVEDIEDIPIISVDSKEEK